MGWYILQGIAFTLGAASALLWYEPGGPITAKQATVAAAGIGVAMAVGATMLASAFLNRRIEHRDSGAGQERIATQNAPPEAREGVTRLDRQS